MNQFFSCCSKEEEFSPSLLELLDELELDELELRTLLYELSVTGFCVFIVVVLRDVTLTRSISSAKQINFKDLHPRDRPKRAFNPRYPGNPVKTSCL